MNNGYIQFVKAGVVDIASSEECDGSSLNSGTCNSVSQGQLPGGSLGCSADCLFDTSNCTADSDGDGVLDDDDLCANTPAGSAVIPVGGFAGCTANQLKAQAENDYRLLKDNDLLQAGSEIGVTEAEDVLQLLVNVTQGGFAQQGGISQQNFLWRTIPPENVVSNKSAYAEKNFSAGTSFVTAIDGNSKIEMTVSSTDDTDIVNAIVNPPGSGLVIDPVPAPAALPGLSDSALVADLLEVRDISILEGSQVFEYQQTIHEKLTEFKGKKINGLLIAPDIPAILGKIESLQNLLVEDSRFLARVLLDQFKDITAPCGDLVTGSAARTECDLGESFINDGLNATNGAVAIDFFKKAWLQGVKVLLALEAAGEPIDDFIARR